MRNLRKPKAMFAVIAAAVGITIGIAGVAGAAIASIPDASGVIHGCYATGAANLAGGSALKVVNAPKGHCISGQTAVSWNASGLPHVLYGIAHDTGSAMTFLVGGKGMQLQRVSDGVTKLTVPAASQQPVISVTAASNDATQHCVIGNNLSSNSYDINCFDAGSPWSTDFHVVAIYP